MLGRDSRLMPSALRQQRRVGGWACGFATGCGHRDDDTGESTGLDREGVLVHSPHDTTRACVVRALQAELKPLLSYLD